MTRVTAWLRNSGQQDGDEVEGVVRSIEAAPTARVRVLLWSLGAALAIAIAAFGLVVARGLVPAQSMPPTGQSSYPIATGDPRFANCFGSSSGVIAAFPMAHAADFSTHLPNAGYAPELETPIPAFVVVFDQSHRWVTVSLGSVNSPRPNHVDVCVWIGDTENGDFESYADIDITGMQPTLPGASPIRYPPAALAPAGSCDAKNWPSMPVPCPTAFAIGGQGAGAHIYRARIWLTTLSAVNTALDLENEVRKVGDATVWVIVYDASASGASATRWLAVVDSVDTAWTDARFIYRQDWSDKAVPDTFPAAWDWDGLGI